MGCTWGNLRVITCQIRGSLWRGNPEPSFGFSRRRCRDLTAGTLTVWPRVKRKSRPQTVRSGPAVKTVVGTHNPKVAGSNPAPATGREAGLFRGLGLSFFLRFSAKKGDYRTLRAGSKTTLLVPITVPNGFCEKLDAVEEILACRARAGCWGPAWFS